MQCTTAFALCSSCEATPEMVAVSGVLVRCCTCVSCMQDLARKMSAAAGFSRFTKLQWDPDKGMNWHSHYMMTP